ncbi:MAG: ABC transporter permease [Acidimicrobiales bacterium]
MPSVLSVAFARGAIEIKQFFRQRDSVVFSLALPVVFLAMLSAIFHGTIPGTKVHITQLLAAGLLAGGVASTSFMNLAIDIAQERDDGTLKRLAGTPMPRVAYFAGKVIVVLVTSLLEVSLLLVVASLAFGVQLPSSPGRWLTFGWVTALGVASTTLLGVAASSVPRSARSAAAVINLPFIVLEFISGVFVPFNQIPSGLRAVASVFPLRWMAEGYRSALLPSSFQRVEPGGSWDHPAMALVLAGWCVIGLIACVRTFRWTRHGTV